MATFRLGLYTFNTGKYITSTLDSHNFSIFQNTFCIMHHLIFLCLFLDRYFVMFLVFVDLGFEGRALVITIKNHSTVANRAKEANIFSFTMNSKIL